ncbi:unnamed protein product, partial [Polarella glacialis]
VVRAWKKKLSGNGGVSSAASVNVPRGDSDDEEDELDRLLDDAMDGDMSEDGGPERKAALPDSFCQFSTTADASSKQSPIPESLNGRHLTADLSEGDLLYLPASWFHEVISTGSDAGGHLALNIWMAPPHAGGSAHQPYEDDFWEQVYQRLRKSAMEGSQCPRRRKGRRKAQLATAADVSPKKVLRKKKKKRNN